VVHPLMVLFAAQQKYEHEGDEEVCHLVQHLQERHGETKSTQLASAREQCMLYLGGEHAPDEQVEAHQVHDNAITSRTQ
jgi:hypothetical protein